MLQTTENAAPGVLYLLCSRFCLDWENLNTVRASPDSRIQEVLDRHSDIFKEELGHIKGAPVTLHTDPSQQPRFFKARPVPYALRTKIETELSRLQGQGVIEPVSFSEWAAPIVPVVKGDGTIRICGDYKLTVNAVAQTDSYPLPRIEDIFASLSMQRKSFHQVGPCSCIPANPCSGGYKEIDPH